MAVTIGIDLGTTTSEICMYKDGKAIPIKDRMHNIDVIPSIVAIDEKTKELKVGKNAEGAYKNVVKEIKRSMGENKKVKLGNKEFSPEEISSIILKHLKIFAEEVIGEEVKEAVITVPANFPIEARKATEVAANLAGLEVLRIIQEPTAAALSFGFFEKGNEEKILVYDLGGGTFDVSIVEIVDGVIDVVAHDGERYLGGTDFDKRLIDYIVDKIFADTKLDISSDDQALQRIKLAAKKAKEELSYSSMTSINEPFIGVINNEPINVELDILREKFEELTADLVEKTIKLIESVLNQAKLKKNQIQQVLLVGGSTRMPLVKKQVENFFGFKPTAGIEPDLAVCIGAAIQASIIKGDSDGIIMDRVAYSFGIKSVSFYGEQLIEDYYSEVIPAQAQMNKEFTQKFVTVHDEQDAINVKCFQKEPTNTSTDVKDMEAIGVQTVIDNLPRVEGELQDVEITMLYNLNGIINVRCKIVSTDEVREWEIETASGKAAKEELSDRMQKLDSLWQQSKYADKAKSLINAVESRLDKMKDEDKKHCETLLAKLKQYLINEDLENTETTIDEITDILINY